jgi:Putative prokaryotic signal transducing protein
MTTAVDNVVVLTTTPNELEAGLIVAELENEGIFATMTGDTLAGFRLAIPALVQVNVFEGDLDRAQEVLRRIVDDRQDIDWSTADIANGNDAPASTGIASLKVWRRGAQVLIILYLIWWSIGLIGGAIQIAAHFVQGVVPAMIG